MKTLMAAILVFSAPLAMTACEDEEAIMEDDDQAADEVGERAEDVAEERTEGEGPLTGELREEVAEERSELAHDVGAEEEAQELVDEPAGTAAQRLADDE